MKIKKYLFIFLFYFITTNIAYSIESDVFVQSTVNRASKLLSDNTSKEEKVEELKKANCQILLSPSKQPNLQVQK